MKSNKQYQIHRNSSLTTYNDLCEKKKKKEGVCQQRNPCAIIINTANEPPIFVEYLPTCAINERPRKPMLKNGN